MDASQRENELTSSNSTGMVMRNYQLEMFDESKKGNTIVVMETGSGKTAVAIYRIIHELEKEKRGKVVWFLTHGVALCAQQHQNIQRMIPAARTQLIVGRDGPERWGSHERWGEILSRVDIVCSTFQVLLDALDHAFVRMEALSLLVFDEAHHCAKGSPANGIMQKHYHKLRAYDGNDMVPAILGLTASPAQNGKGKALVTLEQNLAAVCRTPTVNRLELLKHVHQPTLQRIEYDDHVSAFSLPSVERSPRGISSTSQTKFDTVWKTIRSKIDHLLIELGWWAALEFTRELISILQKKHDQNSLLPSRPVQDAVLESLNPLMQSLEAIHDSVACHDQDEIHLSPKARCLFAHLRELRNSLQKPFTGIVFVRQRIVAAVLDRLLARHPLTREEFKTGCFVGGSNSTSYENDMSELLVPRTQSKVLSDFRTGEKNLVVATDTLDEGIDVSACNAIVCFDPPQNLRSFIQKRGRARQQTSIYSIMAAVNSETMSPETFQKLEKEMAHAMQNETEKARLALLQESVVEEVPYRLISEVKGACVDAKTARAHLEHFCAKLPRQRYTECRPIFKLTEDESGLCQAEVRLPMSVPAGARTARSLRGWQTQKAAIRDAAFHAYKGLYEYKLLTEHLLPLDTAAHDIEDGSEGAETLFHIGTRVCTWDIPDSERNPMHLFCSRLKIECASTGWNGVDLLLWARTDVSSIMNRVELVAEQHRVIHVSFGVRRVAEITTADLKYLQACTNVLSGAARSQAHDKSQKDYVVFLTPNMSIKDLPNWLEKYDGELPAVDFFCSQAVAEPGLVVHKLNGKPLYVLHEHHEISNDSRGHILRLGCSPFPRRRNFLDVTAKVTIPHEDETVDGAEHDFQELDADDCMIRLLPVRYAWTTRLLPSIMSQVEARQLAHQLRTTLLQNVKFASLADVTTAITAPSTMLKDNYEKLEFLGDTLLKFHGSQQVFYEFPQWHEGHLTRQLSMWVKNESLAKAAISVGLDRYIICDAFRGKNWSMPTSTSLDQQRKLQRHLRTKLVADVFEALVGAAYLGGGREGAKLCMSSLMSCFHCRDRYTDGTMHGGEIDGGETQSNLQISSAEELTGYIFNRKFLPMEALTHPSCGRDVSTEPYQRLEFLGDAMLDMVVVKELLKALPSGSPALLTKIKAALVNRNFLAFLCYGHHQVVEMTKFSAFEGTPLCRTTETHQRGFWELMRSESESVADARQQGFERFKKWRNLIVQTLHDDRDYPWEALCMLRSPKFVSDIIESMVGAIFVDSKGSLAPCHAFLERLGVLRYLRLIVEERINVDHPKDELNRLLHGRKMEYSWRVHSVEFSSFALDIVIEGDTISSVSDCTTKEEAIIRASNAAIRILKR